MSIRNYLYTWLWRNFYIDNLCFYYRVQEYITSGQDKMVVDPDKDKIYTKRKTRLSNLPAERSPETPAPKYPSDGWGKSLERMPPFSRAEMNQHIASSGKKVGNADNHSIPTNLRKVKTFLRDEYLKDIEANSDQRYFYLRAKCYHSFRKNDAPHSLRFVLCIVSGEVMHANCSCKAGKVGYCNHVLALMFKGCKFSLYDSQATDDLDNEDDEQPNLACTSQLQRWHAKGRGENIHPQPVMEVTVSKTKLDETKIREGVKSLLYEARMKPTHDLQAEADLKKTLQGINPQFGLSLMAAENSPTAFVQTKFGESQTGSFCSYQLTHTEANFSATIDIASIPRLNNSLPTKLTYPRFPLSAMDTFDIPDNLDNAEKVLIQTLEVDENSINSIESATREQSNSECWKNERKYRFTASRFQLINKRQRNHDKFAAELINPKPFSLRHVEHGLKYEPIALREYEKVMLTRKTPVKVLSCGLVISQHMPILAGSPDARVVDFGCERHFGLAEVNHYEKLNFMLPLWRLVRIPHSAVKLSMDIVNSKGTMLTLLKFRARWVYLEHPGAILLYTPTKGSLWKGLPLTLHTGQN